MAECDSCESETVDLGYIFRSQAKYGTTAHTVHRDDVYVKHKVKPEETLQGISLSYGVTVSLTALSVSVTVRLRLRLRVRVLLRHSVSQSHSQGSEAK